MKSFFLALALLSATVVQAQQFSAGARTGVGFWRGSAYDPKGGAMNGNTIQALWEKEIFFRYEPGKRFAYEAGFTHFEAEGEKNPNPMCQPAATENCMTSGSIRDKYYGLNLRVHYDVSSPEMKKFSHFAGVALTPQLHVAETRDYMINGTTYDQYTERSSVYEASFSFAFEEMLRYQVSRHLDVHSMIACRANVNSTLLMHGFTMQFGAAYRF